MLVSPLAAPMSMANTIPDLNPAAASDQWQRFCQLLWHHEPLALWLDVSRMALSQKQLQDFEEPFQRAFAAMEALEQGAMANPDEQRQVGHYWLRNPALAPDRAVAAQISSELLRIQEFAAQVLAGALTLPHGQAFTDVLWIGIGGSGLGPVLIVRALQENRQGLPFHFLDNVDPDGMSRLFDQLDRKSVV